MQYVELIESLIDRGVRFIVVGGVAVVLHGVPRATFDLDLLLDLETTNVRTFVDIMLAHGLAPRAPVDPYELANPVTRAQWVSEKHLRAFSFFEPRGGAVDVLLSAPIDYDGCATGGTVNPGSASGPDI